MIALVGYDYIFKYDQKSIYLPGTIHGARHFLAGRTIAAANAALIKPTVRADDAIASCLDALALDANSGGVRAAGRAIGHLGVAERRRWNFKVVSAEAVT